MATTIVLYNCSNSGYYILVADLVRFLYKICLQIRRNKDKIMKDPPNSVTLKTVPSSIEA